MDHIFTGEPINGVLAGPCCGSLVEVESEDIFTTDESFDKYPDRFSKKRCFILHQMTSNTVKAGYADSGMEKIDFHYTEVDPETVVKIS